MAFTVQTLVNITGGRLAGGSCERVLTGGVCTDSRAVVPHGVFFALSGERFDGNLFAAEASRQGAAAVVVNRVEGQMEPSCAVIVVPDVLEALQQTALWWRERLARLEVVGITGSSGKTSTKDLVRNVLEQEFRVTATKGNYNNHIGVPVSVLKAEPSDQYAVWEMGMNHAGELAPLCRIARPRIGIITSIGTAHIEFLGSREAIAREKCTLAQCLPDDGAMIYPADCAFASMIVGSTKARCISVGMDKGDVRAEHLAVTGQGTQFDLVIDGFCREHVNLPLHGRHMVSNALLAAATGWVAGMTPQKIVRGLETASLTGGRLTCFTSKGILVIDDTYNANPESMEAALETASALQTEGKRWGVLGKMGELGDFAADAHRHVGDFACDNGFDGIVSVGPGAESITDAARNKAGCRPVIIHHAESTDDACRWLERELKGGDLVLFKGSRSAGMDRIVKTLFPQTGL